MEFKGYESGAIDYMVKPINSSILISKVTLFLDLYEEKRKLKDALQEHRNASEELAKTKNFFSNIISCLPSIIIGIDENNHITEWNNEAVVASGTDKEKALGQNLQDLMPRLTPLLKFNDEIINTRNTYKDEKGKTVYEDITISPLRSETEKGLIIRLDDVTEQVFVREKQRKKLELMVTERTIELETAKKTAENANLAKSNFLANMSHEIRTPMNAILGFTEILKGKIKEPKQLRYLESIHNSGTSLLELINDILDLSKVESGKLELQYTQVSLQKIFDDIANLFSGKIRDKGLDFKIHIADDLPPLLILDGIRLRQVLLNLMSNAIKITESGYISLSISSENTLNKVNLKIVVEDSGIGISEDQHSVIFSAFMQARGQNNAEFGGTGLGLSISMELIKLMHGKIYLDSKKGEGSKFTVELYQIEKSTAVNKSENKYSNEPVKFKAAKILIADDIDFNRELVQVFLEDFGFDIYEACNGKEALEQARAILPDLILMDIKMPVIDGEEAIRLLRQDPILKNIPIIAITASVFPNEIRELSKICNGFLSKPVKWHELIDELMKHLDYEEQDNFESEELIPQGVALVFNEDDMAAFWNDCHKKISPLIKEIENDPTNINYRINLSEALLSICEQYGEEKLINWSKGFNEACNNFNNERIKELVQLWPQLLQYYKNRIK